MAIKVVITVLVVFVCVYGNEWSDLQVKWSPFGPFGGFYPLPRTARDALNAGYVTPPEVNNNISDVQVLCPKKDPTVCLLFDLKGHIAGMEIGVERAQVDNTEYPFERHLMFRPTTRFGYNIYLTTLFFVESAVLSSGGRPSMSGSGTGTGLWLQDGPDRTTLFEVPRLEVNVQKTAYTKENCIPSMGRHYYYNVSESMQCEDFHPIFGLYRHGEMVGFGYQIFGRIRQLGSTNWFENIPPVAVKPTIPNSPQCLVDRAGKHGVVSIHVYFVRFPFLIMCFGE